MTASIPQPLKPALTYEQQIDRLKTVHKLTILDEAAALRILEKVNYYRISAYGIGLKKASNSEESAAQQKLTICQTSSGSIWRTFSHLGSC